MIPKFVMAWGYALTNKILSQVYYRYQVLDGTGWSMFNNFRMSSLGRLTTHAVISVLEWLRIAPAGSKKVHTLLCSAAESLVKAGKLEIFTPMLLFVAKKPSN